MPHTPADAAIFDLDGTLLDTLADIAHASNAALAELRLPPFPVDAYRHMVGEGADVLAQRAVPADRPELIPPYLEGYQRLYAAHAFDHTAPYAGIPAMLDALRAAGVKLAVLSNKPHPATQQVIQHYFPNYPWAAVLGHRPDVPKKPHPDAALDIARQLGLPPRRIAFVGDTKTDILTGVAAGMIPVGVLWGFRDRQELQTAGAREIIAHPDQLPPLLTR